MGRCIVPDAEQILDREFPVLDKGFIRLVDYLGSDKRIAQAARVSYGEGTKTIRQDRGLIDYLLRNEHTSPFEQVIYTFHLKMPLFVARQWLRHRTARLNEVSGRYSIMPDEFYVPGMEDIAEQSPEDRQGRKTEAMRIERAESVREVIEGVQNHAYKGYQELLDSGTARELARVVLPLSLYTEMYWQIDLHNLFHLLRLRLDTHAQKEIRAYAKVMRDLATTVCPIAFESFNQHIEGSVRFSHDEMTALKKLLRDGNHGLEGKKAERLEMKIDENKQS